MKWNEIINKIEWACMNNGVHSSHIGAGITLEYRDRCRELLPKLLKHVEGTGYSERPTKGDRYSTVGACRDLSGYKIEGK